MNSLQETGLSLRIGVFFALLLLVPLSANNGIATPTLVTKPAAKTACNFFPPNNLKFPIRPSGQINEMTFNRVLQVVQQVYAPLFQRAGHPPLQMLSRWQSDDVNAFAQICNEPNLLGTPDYPNECYRMRTANNVVTPLSIVVLFGGLARHPLMSAEGLVLVACHEIGHHLGGYPRYGNNTDWASTEGQSDYFATTKCARNVFAALGGNAQWAAAAPIPLDVRVQCQASFPQSAEQAAICMRSAVGGLALARVLQTAKGQDPRVVDFSHRDLSQVPTTFEGHPAAQCRLDTYYAGSVCQVSPNEAFAPNNPRTGACHATRFENRGPRPNCWYHER